MVASFFCQSSFDGLVADPDLMMFVVCKILAKRKKRQICFRLMDVFVEKGKSFPSSLRNQHGSAPGSAHQRRSTYHTKIRSSPVQGGETWQITRPGSKQTVGETSSRCTAFLGARSFLWRETQLLLQQMSETDLLFQFDQVADEPPRTRLILRGT